jgi:hypothetical protein
VPDPRLSADTAGPGELRRMVLLLETADVLEARARRATDAAQIAVLLRRADQRRRQADSLRERLAARGAALPAPAAQRAPSRRGALAPSPAPGHRRR